MVITAPNLSFIEILGGGGDGGGGVNYDSSRSPLVKSRAGYTLRRSHHV